MERFKLIGTDIVKQVEVGSPRHGIYSRSPRYEALGAVEEPAPEVTLADLTVKDLDALLIEHGMTFDPKWRKARKVEILRDAGVQPPETKES